jgi:predicted RNase H-like HicB family nuclease
MHIPVILEPGEDGWIVAECPALPGCVSQGRTEAEALANIREAIEAWLRVESEKRRPPDGKWVEVVL